MRFRTLQARERIQGILEHLEKISTETKICIVTIILQLVAMYYNIATIGLTTHDDLYQYMFNEKPTLGDFFSRQGEMDVFGTIFCYIQYSAHTTNIYRIYTMVGICLSLGAASLFIKHHISEKSWMKYVVLFLAFMQIGFLHNGAISFGLGYQYRMTLCFLCLDFYVMWCKSDKKKFYILSTVFWILMINAYEAFYMFCIMLFVIALYILHKRNKLSIKNLFYYLWLPAVFTIVFFGLYVIRSMGNSYDGTAVDSAYSIIDKIKSTINYTCGMFPLRVNSLGWRQILEKGMSLDYSTLFMIAKNLLIAFVVCKGIVCEKIRTKREIISVIFMMGLGAVLCSFLVSITARFCNWAIDQGIILYGVSYYSYFFIMIVIFVVLGVLLKLNRKWISTFLFVLVFGISFVTELNNVEVAVQAKTTDAKYEIFNEMIHSEYMSEVEDDSVIYAPEMLGVHHDITSLDRYCKQITNKRVQFCNRLSDVDFSKTVYALRYLPESDTMILGRVEDEQLNTERACVISLQELSDYSLFMVNDNDSMIKIDGTAVGFYDGDVMLPLGQCVDAKKIEITGTSFPMLKISFLKGSVANNATLICEYGEGVSFQEASGRWCAHESEYIIRYEGSQILDGKLYLSVESATGENGAVLVQTKEGMSEHRIEKESTIIEVDVRIQNGDNYVTLESSLGSLVTQDPRDINYKLTNAYCIIDGVEYSFYE